MHELADSGHKRARTHSIPSWVVQVKVKRKCHAPRSLIKICTQNTTKARARRKWICLQALGTMALEVLSIKNQGTGHMEGLMYNSHNSGTSSCDFTP